MECLICFKDKSIVTLSSHFTLCRSFCELLSLPETEYLNELIGLSFCYSCYKRLEKVTEAIQELNRQRAEIQALLYEENEIEINVSGVKVEKEISHILLRNKIVEDLASRSNVESEIIIPDINEYSTVDTSTMDNCNYYEFNQDFSMEPEEPCTVSLNEVKPKVEIVPIAHGSRTGGNMSQSPRTKKRIFYLPNATNSNSNTNNKPAKKIKSEFDQIVLGSIIIPKSIEKLKPIKISSGTEKCNVNRTGSLQIVSQSQPPPLATGIRKVNVITFRSETEASSRSATSKSILQNKPIETKRDSPPLTSNAPTKSDLPLSPVIPEPTKVPEFRIRKYIRRVPLKKKPNSK